MNACSSSHQVHFFVRRMVSSMRREVMAEGVLTAVSTSGWSKPNSLALRLAFCRPDTPSLA